MNETELERLVVRLTGDGSQYQKMLTDAQASTRVAASVIEQASKKIEGFTTGLKGFASTALSALGMFGVGASATAMFQGFAQAERGQIRLTAAIEAGGHDAGETMARYNAFARSLSEVTLTTRGSTMGMLQQAEAMGFSGERAERLIRNAVALGGATGEEAAQYIHVVAAMERGNVQLLRRIPQLRGIHDETELVNAANRLMASGMQTAQAEFNSVGGRIERLQRSLGGISKEVGALIADAIMPVVSWLQKAADWFKSLDPIVKNITTIIVALLAVLASWPAIAAIFGPVVAVFTTILGVVGSLGAPLLAVIGIVTALAYTIVQKLGGVQAVWEMIKTAAEVAWDWIRAKIDAFMEWVSPIAKALGGLLSTIWDIVVTAVISAYDILVEVWNQIFDLVAGVWKDIFGETEIDWKGIQDFIIDAILAVEFAITHFGDVVEYLWTGIKFKFAEFVNEQEYIWTVVIPTLLDYFKDNWLLIIGGVVGATIDYFVTTAEGIVEIFTNIPWEQLWDSLRTSVETQVANIINVFASIWDLISGSVDFNQIWAAGQEVGSNFLDGVVDNIQGQIDRIPDAIENGLPPLVIPARVRGEVEQQLLDEFNALGEALGDSWEAFRAQRLAELGITSVAGQAVINSAAELGTGIGAAINHGVKKESDKLEATLRGSAEAISRIAQYKEKLNAVNRAGSATGSSAGATGASSASSSSSPARDPALQRMVELLTSGNTLLGGIKDNTGALAAAGL